MAEQEKQNIKLEKSDDFKSVPEIKKNIKSLEAKVNLILKQQSQLAAILKEHNMLLRRSLGLGSQSQKPILSKTKHCVVDVQSDEQEEEEDADEEEDRSSPLDVPTRRKIPQKAVKGKRGRSLSQLSTASSLSSRQFPLKTEDDVDRLNEKLKGHNKNEVLTLISQLLAGTIANIERILSTELVYNFNYDGSKGKIPLKSYSHFVAALYEATKKPDSTHEYFVFELRATFRKLKNKYQKRLQKQRELDPLKAAANDMDLSLFPDLSD